MLGVVDCVLKVIPELVDLYKPLNTLCSVTKKYTTLELSGETPITPLYIPVVGSPEVILEKVFPLSVDL